MERWKKITAAVTVLTIAALGVYDVVAIQMGGTEASISHMIIMYAYQYPLMPFLTGVVMGHLFWRMKPTKETLKMLDKNE